MGEDGKASMALDALEVGSCAVIDEVRGSGELRRHLLDMGLTPGVGVRLRKVAPMGDPLQVELRGYELTLRVSDAQQVAITPVDALPASSRDATHVAPLVAAGHPGIGEAGAAGDEGVRNGRRAPLRLRRWRKRLRIASFALVDAPMPIKA